MVTQAPLIILENVEAFLDARGLGAGPVTRDADRRRRRLELHVPARARRANGSCCAARRGRRCRRRRTTWCVRPACRTRSAPRASRGSPEIVAVCDDESVIGVPFYVMRFLDGHVITQRTPARARDRRRALRARAGPRRHAGRDPRRRRRHPELEAFARPGSYLERQVKPLRAAVGDQPDARDRRRRRGRPLPDRERAGRRSRRRSCTATTGSGT